MADVFKVPNSTCIGLDFGTTNSSVALYGDKLVLIELDGARLFRSNIYYDEVIIKSIKRIISNLDEIHNLKLRTKIVDGMGYIYIANSWKSVIEIAADLLKNIRFNTNKALNQDIKNAVLTVPARFDEVQRQFIVQAATLAGWSIRRVIAEPTAAFIAQNLNQNGIYGVYDLGGGTFDFSIVRKVDDVIQVIGTAGDTSIGGDYFDEILAKSYDLSIDEARLMRERGELDISCCNHLIDISIKKCIELIETTKVEPELIILVGGAIRMKEVQDKVREIGIPVKVSEDPQEVVAKGAAIYAKQLMEQNIQLLIDVTPLSLGVETSHGMVEWIINRNSPLPFARKMMFTNSDSRQTHILFHVVQGEGIFAKDCRSIGRFKVPITPQKPNTVKIEVEFLLNVDGLLQINCTNLTYDSQMTDNCAKDHNEDRYSIEFEPGSGLTQDMINKILHTCSVNAVVNERQKEFYKVRTEVDSIVRTIGTENLDSNLSERFHSMSNLYDALSLLHDIENRYNDIITNRLKLAIKALISSS